MGHGRKTLELFLQARGREKAGRLRKKGVVSNGEGRKEGGQEPVVFGTTPPERVWGVHRNRKIGVKEQKGNGKSFGGREEARGVESVLTIS